MGGDFLAGLVGGLAPHVTGIVQQRLAEQAEQDQFELGVLQHLATAKNPNIRTVAVAGLLEHQQQLAKRKGGGILGKLFNRQPQENKTFRKLREIIGQFPSQGGSGGPAPDDLGASLALPEPSAPAPPPETGAGAGGGALDLLSLLSKGPGGPDIMSPGQPTGGASLPAPSPSSPTPAGLTPGGPPPMLMPPQGAAAQPPRGQDLVSAQGPISPMAAGTGAGGLSPSATPPPGPAAAPGFAAGAPGPLDFSSILSQVAPPETPPASLADIYSQVQGVFPPDALGNIGPLGEKAFAAELGGRVTDRQQYAEEARARRAAATLAAAGERAARVARDAMDRIKTRTDAAWERQKDQQKFRAAHPTGRGRSWTFNAASFRVRAQRDFAEDVLQIQGKADEAIARLRADAVKSYLSEDKITPIIAEIQASATRRLTELQAKHQELLDEIERGVGGREDQGGQGGGIGPRTTGTDTPVGATATNPTTGARVRWDGTRWVPVK